MSVISSVSLVNVSTGCPEEGRKSMKKGEGGGSKKHVLIGSMGKRRDMDASERNKNGIK